MGALAVVRLGPMTSVHGKLVTLRPLIRRGIRRGRRLVLLTPDPGPRFGNFLYYWLHADMRRRRGETYLVLTRDHIGPWLDALPVVREELTIRSGAMRPWDRREWPPTSQFQRFGEDFGAADLDLFIREMVLGSPLMRGGRLTVDADGANEPVVVNVRRGDYYAIPEFRQAYGFDVVTYVGEALRRIADREPISRVLVVSDDIAWCRANLDVILRPKVPEVRFVSPTATPLDHFRAVARARRVVGANSTFSYWAGYVATVLHGARAHVVMPGFHSRAVAGGRAFQLDDRWDVVRDLPGGWNPV